MRWRKAVSGVALLCTPLLVWAAADEAGFRLDGTRTRTLTPGSCLRFEYDTGFFGDDNYVYVGGMEVVVSFEADPDGVDTTGSILLGACTRADTDADGTKDGTACTPLNVLDSNADGIPDTNVLTDSSGQRRTPKMMRSGWLNFVSFDVTNTPNVLVCAR